jgi:DNA-binding LacI/PurR family transcriptional regulator
MDNLSTGPKLHPRFAIGVQSKNGPHGTDPFFEELLTGMEEALDRHEATVMLRQFGSYQDELDAYPRWAGSGDVDAVVVVDSQEKDSRARLCLELGLPVVVLGGPATTGVSLVDVDNSGAMEMAVNFLAELGHRTVGRVSGPAHLHHTKARSVAFDRALASRGLGGFSLEGDYSAGSGAARTRQMLTGAERPSAIVYDNSIMAVAGLSAVHEAGMKVPQDVSLLAWDDGPHCRLSDPPFSVVSLDVYELGRIVAEVLMQTYSGALQTVVHVPTARIIQRGSTSSWASAGPLSRPLFTDPAPAPGP